MLRKKSLDEEHDDERDLTAEERRDDDDFKDQDLGWEDGDPADRRKDPLRSPLSPR